MKKKLICSSNVIKKCKYKKKLILEKDKILHLVKEFYFKILIVKIKHIKNAHYCIGMGKDNIYKLTTANAAKIVKSIDVII